MSTQWRIRTLFLCVGIGLVAALLSLPTTGSETPTVGKPIVTPTTIVVGQKTEVTATSLVSGTVANPLLVNGVKLFRVDPTTNISRDVGTMHDDGLAGDAVAGDGIFTLRFTTTERTAGSLPLRVYGTFKRLHDRVLSDITVLSIDTRPVANAGPDQTVFVGDVVHLDGGGSTDVDGQILTFA